MGKCVGEDEGVLTCMCTCVGLCIWMYVCVWICFHFIRGNLKVSRRKAKRSSQRKKTNRAVEEMSELKMIRITFDRLYYVTCLFLYNITNQLDKDITLSFFPRYLTSIICPDTKPAASGDAIFLLSSSDTCTKPSYPGNISTNTPKLCTPLITQSL